MNEVAKGLIQADLIKGVVGIIFGVVVLIISKFIK